MAFFDLFSSKPKRFVSENAFEENLAKQVAMAPMTMKQLRTHGVTDDSTLKLEFFFYTNDPSKAASLVASLRERGYSAKQGRAAHDKSIQAISGWTDKIGMNDATVISWTKEMCELGFANDCNFDGWGTDPHQ